MQGERWRHSLSAFARSHRTAGTSRRTQSNTVRVRISLDRLYGFGGSASGVAPSRRAEEDSVSFTVGLRQTQSLPSSKSAALRTGPCLNAAEFLGSKTFTTLRYACSSL